MSNEPRFYANSLNELAVTAAREVVDGMLHFTIRYWKHRTKKRLKGYANSQKGALGTYENPRVGRLSR